MRIRSLLVFATTAVFILSGCEKTNEKPSPAEITLKSEAAIGVSSAETTKSITFVANRDWTATVSEAAQSWLSVTPTSGKASDKEQVVSVKALANTEAERSGSVTISIMDGGKIAGSKSVTVTQENGIPPYTEATVEEVLAGTATGGVIVEGFVMAAGNNAFVINDGGEKSLYVFGKNVAAPAARTKVKVQGTVATYGATNLIQLTEIEVSESTKDFNITTPTPKKLDAAGVDAYAENWSELVAIQGVLKKSGNYLNIEIGGDRVGSIVACPGTDALVDGKTYGIIGFFAGVSGSSTKYFNVLPAVISEIDTREPCVKIFEDAGYKMEDYTRLAIDWTHNGYWNSTDGTNHSKIITGQSNSSQFAATPQYHRSALPVGSVLVVQGATAEVSNGWMYRPEGWQSKGSKNNGKRPDNVTGKASPVVVVDDAWWGTSFYYRAFNVARVGNPNLTEAQQEELEHIFGVFIPKPLASTDEMLRKGGYDPANFTKLEFTYTKDAFYNSTSDTNSNLVTTGANVVQFVATSIVEKAQIPNGSVIVVNYGYQYRPEGWQTLGTKNSATRPANVGKNVVVVDDAWWGNYNYRAFNLAKFGNPSMTEASERDAVIAAFAVYVPKN
ncbi:MAG: hypothetical protein IKZ71_05115 [Bacteroidales bacterium]|nr:hypothetical protein [Bacteroidales bacterium]